MAAHLRGGRRSHSLLPQCLLSYWLVDCRRGEESCPRAVLRKRRATRGVREAGISPGGRAGAREGARSLLLGLGLRVKSRRLGLVAPLLSCTVRAFRRDARHRRYRRRGRTYPRRQRQWRVGAAVDLHAVQQPTLPFGCVARPPRAVVRGCCAGRQVRFERVQAPGVRCRSARCQSRADLRHERRVRQRYAQLRRRHALLRQARLCLPWTRARERRSVVPQ
mmetsp:Transcript_3543/g.8893  ORF Transcript_3543/g.8893 Transcript_3543/m.8893 type:complete len:221 (+) Transcript_3543:946-1608(+)